MSENWGAWIADVDPDGRKGTEWKIAEGDVNDTLHALHNALKEAKTEKGHWLEGTCKPISGENADFHSFWVKWKHSPMRDDACDYVGTFHAYGTCAMQWDDRRNCYDELPASELDAKIATVDEDGWDTWNDSYVWMIPDGWDSCDTEPWSMMGEALCIEHGFRWDPVKWSYR